MRWLFPCLLAAGCGRIGFQSQSEVAGDDTITPDGAANYMFVTSQQVAIGGLGSLDAADALCNRSAAAASLPGTYVAWLSTTTSNAIDRLASARGWIRRDGRPFADTPADIATGRIWYPPSIDERGDAMSTAVATTSDAHGVFDGHSCSDFTDDTMDMSFDLGDSSATTAAFASFPGIGGLCDIPAAMYCFAIDHNVLVQAPQPRAGVHIFPAEGFVPGGGLTAADALCAQTAQAAGATGTFRAVLTTAAAAAARFDATAGPVVRPDGIELAATVGDALAGKLASAPNVTLDGRYLSGPVWAGGSDTAHTTNSATCNNWTSRDAGQFGEFGELAAADVGFFGLNTFGTGRSLACNGANPIYCLEQ